MSPFERTSQQQVPHRRLEEQPREVQMGEEAQAEELNLEFVQQVFSLGSEGLEFHQTFKLPCIAHW